MLKHTICHIEFNSTNIERTTAFYQTLFGWTLTPLQRDYMLFRSPDGISGAFRELDAVSPLDIPSIQIEVSDFAPLIDLDSLPRRLHWLRRSPCG